MALGQQPPPAHTPDPRRASAPLDPPQPRPLPEHLQDLAHSLTRKLDDLDSYQVPQLAHCQGPLAFHHELAAAVRSELAGCRRDIEEFKLEVDDLERARDRAAAAQHVQALQQRIDSSTKLYRQAVVASKRQIDAYGHLAARDELLAPGADSSGRASPGPYGPQGGSRARSPQPSQSADDALMSATSDVTEGLRRTLQLMQQEVDRSLVSNELLESQTKTMELTSNQYSTLSSLLHTSRALITALERSAVLDRLVLFGAFAFFAAVCAHIFKKRVIDRGVHVLGAVGSVVGAVGRRAGAGAAGAAVVDKAGEVVEAAGGAVKDEAKGEIARAAAAAGALAGAAWRGAEALRARAFPHDAGEGETGEEERELAHEVVPAREEGEGRVRTEPVQPPADVDLDEAVTGDGDVFYEAPELVDDPPAPTTAEPLPLSTAEHAPAAPSPSPVASPEPARQLPLDADISSHDDLDALETGDADLPDETAPPPAAAETVALREEQPPAPSLDAQNDVAFEPVSAHEAVTEPTPDAHEQDEASRAASVPERAHDDDERIFHPLERLRPTRPDLDAQLGDVQGIVDAHASEPAADAPEADALDEVLPIVEEDGALELDEQAQDSSITAPQPSSASPPVEEEPAAVELPTAADEDAPLIDLADAEEAQHVAEAHAGGDGGTRVPEAAELREGGLPPLDVNGEGAPDLEQEALEEVALPIDLEKEQTVWERDEEDESEAARVAAEQDEEEVRAEQSDEALLDEMLEAQLGGMVGGAAQHAVGAVTANDTAPSEPVDAVTQEQEPAVVDPAPSEASLPEAPAAYDDFPLDDTTSIAEPPAAIPEDAPMPASTAATTAEPTPAPTDSALDDAVAPITTAEPTVSAAPVAASELDFAELAAHEETVAPPPAAEAEESVEPAQPSSTGAPIEPDDSASTHAVLDDDAEDQEPDVAADELEDGSEDDELGAAPIEEDDLPLVLGDRGDDDESAHEDEAGRDEEDEVASAFFDEGDEQGRAASALDIELPVLEAEDELDTHDGDGSAGEGEGDQEPELEERDLAATGQVEHETDDDDAEPALESSLPGAYDVDEESGEYALSTDELDADVANSDVVFPDSSIDADDAVDSSAPLSPSIDADADDNGSDDSGAVFESAADEAVSDHVGEQAPSAGHDADEALHRAEDILDELEHEYEDGEEYYEGEEEGEYERYDGEEEGVPYYEEEEVEAPAQRDEL